MTTLIIIIFVLGYLAIIFEHQIHLDKAAAALITGVLCWTLLIFEFDHDTVHDDLYHHFAEISSILFFLVGAMVIVELIDLNHGFRLILSRIKTRGKRKIFVILTAVSFVFSAMFDNLTTAIIMASILNKILEDKKDRWLFAGMVIIAANAGGAWSPIGDVTTTMLWVGGQITTLALIKSIIIPSIVCALIPMFILAPGINGNITTPERPRLSPAELTDSRTILFSGIALLLFVPIFKTLTGLPPFMGMFLSLGILWAITATLDQKNRNKDNEIHEDWSIFKALEKIDMPSILFFAGILLAVGAMQVAGILDTLSTVLETHLKDQNLIVGVIGMASSIFDNVPLVAALQAMYDYPVDSSFWHFLAYCAGTGGSLLIIGSAAGVALMGIEKINFFWYLKRISWVALIGYLAGCGVYLLLN